MTREAGRVTAWTPGTPGDFGEFLRIDPDDDERLREMGRAIPPAEKAAFVAAFYRHLRKFDELDRILSVPGHAEHLNRSLARYVDSLFTAPIDDLYVEDRTRTGTAHLNAGLQPRWYLGAYALFIEWWLPHLLNGPGGQVRVRAFLKRLLFDAVLAMDTYVSGRLEDLAREKEGLTHEKETLGNEVRTRSRLLVESEQRYEDLVENAPEMIHQVDAARRFTNMNRTELVRLGYTLEEIRQMKLEQIVPPAFRNSIVEHVQRVIDEGSSRMETVFRTKSGEEFPVEIYATAQRDLGGRFLQTRAFVRDLSERRRLERELARWERLASVGSMAAKVAHEIRNPLSAISLNVELLSDELLDVAPTRRGEVEPLLTTILGGVDRLNAIVEEYLAFARLPPMEMRETSLQEVVHSLEQLVRPDLERHNIRWIAEIPDDLPAVPGDRSQLQQVFLNLIRNSQDAMPDGGEIRLTATVGPDGIEMNVADTGTGIPEKSLPLIFDPFFTTKDAGTGLGLAYVQQVLVEHHARVVCTSRLGNGTEFRITFRPSGKPRPSGTARAEAS